MKKRHLYFVILFSIIFLIMFVSAARLPNVGGDDDSWGTVLNEFLNVSHNSTGHLIFRNVDLNNTYNVTNASYGFFDFLGGIGNRITSLFVQNVNVSNTLNVSGNTRLNQNLTVGGNVNISDILTLNPQNSPTSSNEGGLFYNSSSKTLMVNNGTEWLGLSGVPEGTIAAFNGSCPTGWDEYSGNNQIETADAWVSFNGTECSGSPSKCTILDSFNVDNVFWLGTGHYNISFISNFANQNYSVMAMSSRTGTTTSTGFNNYADKLKGSVEVSTTDASGTADNHADVSMVAFGNSTNQLTYCQKVQQDSLKSESFWGKIADKLFVQNTSLNVGIGTTSPNATLDVNGSFETPHETFKLSSPVIFAAYKSSDQTLGSTGKVTFDTERFDPGGNYNTSNSVFTAPVDGYYYFTANAIHDSASGTINLRIKKNWNGTTGDTGGVAGHSANEERGDTPTGLFSLSAGDEIVVLQVGSATIYGDSNHWHSRFEGRLVHAT